MEGWKRERESGWERGKRERDRDRENRKRIERESVRESVCV